jgi:hypothetical protein
MAPLRRGGAAKRHQLRLEWLGARPDRCTGVPGIHSDVSEEGRARLRELHLDMLRAHLFGAGPGQEQRDTIRRLVSELRGETSSPGGKW